MTDMDVIAFRNELVTLLSENDDIVGIGQTGDINAPLIPGKSDIDLFVLCDRVPDGSARSEMYKRLTTVFDGLRMEVCSGGVWGFGDIFDYGGIDVMPMYFTVSEMNGYADELLAGLHLEKEGRFYPVGRLASIESLSVLYENGSSWTDIIDKVKRHPPELFARMYEKEAAYMIDEEDLSRASLRHEVLFYHQVVEEFLDHFLQALYAKNDAYFPSRKRAEKAIEAFKVKPDRCLERLYGIIRLASYDDSIEESISELRSLAEDLKRIRE